MDTKALYGLPTAPHTLWPPPGSFVAPGALLAQGLSALAFVFFLQPSSTTSTRLAPSPSVLCKMSPPPGGLP